VVDGAFGGGGDGRRHKILAARDEVGRRGERGVEGRLGELTSHKERRERGRVGKG
jgi:hypothetical protein